MSRALRGAGAEVQTAPSVRSGLVLLAAGIDVLITDYNLELGTSAPLIRAALGVPVPVVVLTALPDGVDRELARSVIVLEKPVAFGTLEATILGLVGRSMVGSP